MKKFILFVTMMLSVAAVAAPKYNLKDGEHKNAFPVLSETVQYDGDYKVYTKYTSVNYYVTDSMNRPLPPKWPTTDYDVAKVSFKTNDTIKLGIWTDIDGKATPGEAHIDLNLNVTNYGIYFLDEDVNGVHNYLSLIDDGVIVEAGRAFGVYYEDNGTNTYTTTDNWVASFDNAAKDPHVLTSPTWYEDDPSLTKSHFLCLFQGQYEDWPTKLEWDHWEFGFVREEYTEPEPPVGQPLPGTLASILIGGLCVSKLKKKENK